jgi:hypothetical protein
VTAPRAFSAGGKPPCPRTRSSRAARSSLEPAWEGGSPRGPNRATNPSWLVVYRGDTMNALELLRAEDVDVRMLGLDGEYFTTSPQAAANYARQAVRGFKGPPYTIVGTQVPRSVLNQPGISA